MKTILHLRSTFHAGGTENLIVRLYNTPSERFRIILLLLKPGKMMDDLESDSNQVFHIYRSGKFDIGLIIQLIGIIKKHKPDAIHTHQWIELFYALLMKLRFPKLKLYHQIHLHNPTSTFWFVSEKIICNLLVRKVILVSNTLKKYVTIHGFKESKCTVLYNIVTITNKISEAAHQDFLQRINYHSGDFIIGMIGNFVPEKDQYTLASAAKKLLEDGGKYKFVFIGKEGPTTINCREIFQGDEIGNQVLFMGQIPNASELIRHFNLSVFSSKTETFGLAAIESLLYQIPVLASDIPVMAELSNNGSHFELFSTGNSEDLEQKIRAIVTNPVLNDKLQRSRNYALSAFSPEVYVEKLAKVYEC